jgi:hypothetical protein
VTDVTGGNCRDVLITHRVVTRSDPSLACQRRRR